MTGSCFTAAIHVQGLKQARRTAVTQKFNQGRSKLIFAEGLGFRTIFVSIHCMKRNLCGCLRMASPPPFPSARATKLQVLQPFVSRTCSTLRSLSGSP